MYRRSLLLVAAFFIFLSLFFGSRPYTVATGGAFGGPTRDHLCGTTFGVNLYEEYEPGIERTFLERRCYAESKQRIVNVGLAAIIGIGALLTGLARGPAPPLQSIHVLTPLPTPEEMKRSRVGDPGRFR
jgi:hypothetical protein